MWKPRARNLEEAVLETIAWFSIFSYPVTAIEAWRFSFFKGEYLEYERGLLALVARGVLLFKDGLYALPGEERSFDEREIRYRASLPKLERAKRAAAYLSRFKDIRAVFVCNTLSHMHAREASDIDLFVIARHGSIWRMRFAAVTPYALLNRRPKLNDERDALCWSFFLSDADFNLRPYALSPNDPYLAFWIATLLPLYDPEALIGKIRTASGINELFPQFSHTPVMSTGTLRGHFGLPAFLESPLRVLQMRRFPEAIRTQIGKGTNVAVSDHALKFHTNDRRASYRASFEERLRLIGL